MELEQAYNTLKLPFNSSLDDVKKAYRLALQKVNAERKPTFAINKRVLAEERFKAIVDAYHTAKRLNLAYQQRVLAGIS